MAPNRAKQVKTTQTWPELPLAADHLTHMSHILSQAVGATAGTSSRVSHPSPATRAADFDTDYLAHICSCYWWAHQLGKPS